MRGRVLDNPPPSEAVEGEGVGAAYDGPGQFVTDELPDVPLRITVGAPPWRRRPTGRATSGVHVPSRTSSSPWMEGTVELAAPFRGVTDPHRRRSSPGAVTRTIVRRHLRRRRHDHRDRGTAGRRRCFDRRSPARRSRGRRSRARPSSTATSPQAGTRSSTSRRARGTCTPSCWRSFGTAGSRSGRCCCATCSAPGGRSRRRPDPTRCWTMHPGLRFVLSGDSGEKDPQSTPTSSASTRAGSSRSTSARCGSIPAAAGSRQVSDDVLARRPVRAGFRQRTYSADRSGSVSAAAGVVGARRPVASAALGYVHGEAARQERVWRPDWPCPVGAILRQQRRGLRRPDVPHQVDSRAALARHPHPGRPGDAAGPGAAAGRGAWWTPRRGVRAPTGRSTRCRPCSAPTTTRAASSRAHPVLVDAWRRHRTGGWAAPAWCWRRWCPSIIEQKVTGQEAFAGFRTLVHRYGERAPGPGPRPAARGCSRRRDAAARSRRGSGCGCTSTRPAPARSSRRPGRGRARADRRRCRPTRPTAGCARCPASACGPVPRCASARSATPTRSASATTTSPRTSAGR